MLIMDKATKGSAGGPMGSSRVFGTNMRMGTHRTTGGKRGVSAANDRGPAPTSNTADFAGKIQSARRPPQHFMKNSLAFNDAHA